MIEKIYKKVLFTLILLFTLTFSFTMPEVNAAPSNEKYVIPGGNSIGLKIDTGVYIAGKYEVKTSNDKVSPWMMSDIEVGDKIIKYNDLNVLTANNLITFLNHETSDKVRLTILRNKRTLQTNIKVVETVTGAKSLGLYLKDKLLGVGTLTFIDPASKLYASLGHGIYDQKVIIGDVDGTLTFSNVESIKKGNAGLPGEKRASLSKKEIYLPDEMFNDIQKFQKKLMLWGSNRVVKAWIEYRANAGTDGMNALFYMEKILYAIRKDMGYKNLGKGKLLSMSINDFILRK